MARHDEDPLRSESIDSCLHETRIFAIARLLASGPWRLSGTSARHIHCIFADEAEPVSQTTCVHLHNALLRRPVRCAEG